MYKVCESVAVTENKEILFSIWFDWLMNNKIRRNRKKSNFSVMIRMTVCFQFQDVNIIQV